MLSEKIKTLRKKHKLKQEELANILGVSRSQITSYEINRSKPSFSVLIKMADYFKMPLDYFYEGEEQKQELLTHTLELTDEELTKRVEIYFSGEKLSPEEVSKVIEYVRFLRFSKDNK